MPDLALRGCPSEPLLSYLKALGVLRLVSEQVDRQARGFWQGGTFQLRSSCDDETLVTYFLERYKPTPILAPWNGGCGFYVKWDPDKEQFKQREAVEAINSLSSSTSLRLEPYRADVRAAKRALLRFAEPVDLRKEVERVRQEARNKGLSREKVKKEVEKFLGSLLLFEDEGQPFQIAKADKDTFLVSLRGAVVSDYGLQWLDAALTLLTGRTKNCIEAPTLGSGGNVGNSDFSVFFAQQLAKVLPLCEGEDPPAESRPLLRAALVSEPVAGLTSTSIGQFDPGKAGGANAGQGLEGFPRLNSWDYILMLEGSLLLSGAASRRFGAGSTSAAFPFVVNSSSVGYGAAGADNTRGEIWLPLWNRPCTAGEIKLLLSEGRAEIGRRLANSGVTFARAVAALGIDRGVAKFVRYEFQERLGQSYLATPIGRFPVRDKPVDGIDLLRETDEWLERIRWIYRKDTTPPRFAATLRNIDAATFEFCLHGEAFRLANVLAAYGRAERELANADRLLSQETSLLPLRLQSEEWVRACDDRSTEFRIARGVAFITGDSEGRVGPLRTNLEPVNLSPQRRWVWAEGGSSVVWSGADLCRNLAAVLERRVLDGRRSAKEEGTETAVLPLFSPYPVPLEDIALFLEGRTDDERIAELRRFQVNAWSRVSTMPPALWQEAL